MWGHVLLLSVAAAGLSTTYAQECQFDNVGTRGVCLRVSQCSQMLRLVRLASDQRQPTSRRSQIVAFLRAQNRKCATPQDRQLLCCRTELRLLTTPPITEPPATAPPRPRDGGATTILPEECGKVAIDPRIIDGEKADVGQFPWMASIQVRDSRGSLAHSCGGTLITARHVLTAAHCLTSRNTPVGVVLGELDFNSPRDCSNDDPPICSLPVFVDIEAFKQHPRFENIDELGIPNDIGIIKLDRDVEITDFVRPICLLENATDLHRGNIGDRTVNTNSLIAGWGKFEPDSGEQFSPHLLYARVPIQPIRNCSQAFRLRVSFGPGRICAGTSDGGADTCRGDSGGPLMLTDRFGTQYFQTGISSFGLRQCGTVSAYTRVMDYIDWIRETIRIL